jgi:hypothetical protein
LVAVIPECGQRITYLILRQIYQLQSLKRTKLVLEQVAEMVAGLLPCIQLRIAL